MNLNRRLFGFVTLLAASVWAVGCAEETTVEDPAGNGGAVEAPDNDPATDAGGDIDDPAGTDTGSDDGFGLEGGSTTGAGTDIPDPLDGAETPAPADEPEPEQP